MKWINDTFGHQEGDIALANVADIIKTTFRESDIMARIGGDEICCSGNRKRLSKAKEILVKSFAGNFEGSQFTKKTGNMNYP